MLFINAFKRRALLPICLMITASLALAGCGGGSNGPAKTQTKTGAEQVVFIGERNGKSALFTVNLDGSNLTFIPTNSGTQSLFSATLSPDKRTVAYTNFVDGGRGGYVTDIRSVNVDGSNDHEILPIDSFEPVFSPDGQRLAFTASNFGPNLNFQNGIYLANADGTNPTFLTEGVDASWSANGKRILYIGNFSQGGDVFIINTDGTNATNLTHSAQPESNARLSPDGTRVVYETNETVSDSNGVGPKSRIEVINVDGSNLRVLARDFSGGFVSTPRWTRDGRIVYSITGEPSNTGLYIINADGLGQARLPSALNGAAGSQFEVR